MNAAMMLSASRLSIETRHRFDESARNACSASACWSLAMNRVVLRMSRHSSSRTELPSGAVPTRDQSKTACSEYDGVAVGFTRSYGMSRKGGGRWGYESSECGFGARPEFSSKPRGRWPTSATSTEKR